MQSTAIKRSIVINGTKTSVSLEDAFWDALKELVQTENTTLSYCVAAIDESREKGNLSSAIRVFLFQRFRAQLASPSVQPDMTPTAPLPVNGGTIGRANDLSSAAAPSRFAARLRAAASFANSRRTADSDG